MSDLLGALGGFFGGEGIVGHGGIIANHEPLREGALGCRITRNLMEMIKTNSTWMRFHSGSAFDHRLRNYYLGRLRTFGGRRMQKSAICAVSGPH